MAADIRTPYEATRAVRIPKNENIPLIVYCCLHCPHFHKLKRKHTTVSQLSAGFLFHD